MPKGQYQRESLESRLEKQSSRNEATGCLFYTGHLDRYGYGQTSVSGKTTTVHRAMWISKNGEVPEGKIIGHSCDEKYPADSNENRKCFELSHLYLTDTKENIQRAYRLGRAKISSGAFKPGQTAGEQNGRSVLTKEKILEIRRRFNAGLRHGEQVEMAIDYDVEPVTIQAIIKGRIWKDAEYFP